jgi:hypothetical protein
MCRRSAPAAGYSESVTVLVTAAPGKLDLEFIDRACGRGAGPLLSRPGPGRRRPSESGPSPGRRRDRDSGCEPESRRLPAPGAGQPASGGAGARARRPGRQVRLGQL